MSHSCSLLIVVGNDYESALPCFSIVIFPFVQGKTPYSDMRKTLLCKSYPKQILACQLSRIPVSDWKLTGDEIKQLEQVTKRKCSVIIDEDGDLPKITLTVVDSCFDFEAVLDSIRPLPPDMRRERAGSRQTCDSRSSRSKIGSVSFAADDEEDYWNTGLEEDNLLDPRALFASAKSTAPCESVVDGEASVELESIGASTGKKGYYCAPASVAESFSSPPTSPTTRQWYNFGLDCADTVEPGSSGSFTNYWMRSSAQTFHPPPLASPSDFSKSSGQLHRNSNQVALLSPADLLRHLPESSARHDVHVAASGGSRARRYSISSQSSGDDELDAVINVVEDFGRFTHFWHQDCGHFRPLKVPLNILLPVVITSVKEGYYAAVQPSVRCPEIHRGWHKQASDYQELQVELKAKADAFEQVGVLDHGKLCTQNYLYCLPIPALICILNICRQSVCGQASVR